MEIGKAITEYLIEVEIRGYTKKTRDGYRRNLRMFERYCKEIGIGDTDELSMSVVKGFVARLMPGHKGTYLNGSLKVIKSFDQYIKDEGIGDISKGKKYPWVKEQKPIIRAFATDDVKKLLADCDNSFTGVRDRAVLTTMLETGVRCWELCCIQQEDVKDDHIVIRYGKNHKERSVPITPILKKTLIRYESEKTRYFQLKDVENYYFLSFHGKQLTNSAVEHIVKRHGDGIKDVRISPHTLRHTFAQSQLRMGTDLYTISRLLGHENISITQTYLRSLRDEDIVQQSRQRSVLQSMGL